MNELTRKQIIQQDFVDNEINWMLNRLMDELKSKQTSYKWNIEDIANIER